MIIGFKWYVLWKNGIYEKVIYKKVLYVEGYLIWFWIFKLRLIYIFDLILSILICNVRNKKIRNYIYFGCF